MLIDSVSVSVNSPSLERATRTLGFVRGMLLFCMFLQGMNAMQYMVHALEHPEEGVLPYVSVLTAFVQGGIMLLLAVMVHAARAELARTIKVHITGNSGRGEA